MKSTDVFLDGRPVDARILLKIDGPMMMTKTGAGIEVRLLERPQQLEVASKDSHTIFYHPV